MSAAEHSPANRAPARAEIEVLLAQSVAEIAGGLAIVRAELGKWAKINIAAERRNIDRSFDMLEQLVRTQDRLVARMAAERTAGDF